MQMQIAAKDHFKPLFVQFCATYDRCVLETILSLLKNFLKLVDANLTQKRQIRFVVFTL